jgi:hypothetical protein
MLSLSNSENGLTEVVHQMSSSSEQACESVTMGLSKELLRRDSLVSLQPIRREQLLELPPESDIQFDPNLHQHRTTENFRYATVGIFTNILSRSMCGCQATGNANQSSGGQCKGFCKSSSFSCFPWGGGTFQGSSL